MHEAALDIRKINIGDGYKVSASLHKLGWIRSQQGKNENAAAFLVCARDLYKNISKTGELGKTSYLFATVLAALRQV
jgi:hypothetical protein